MELYLFLLKTLIKVVKIKLFQIEREIYNFPFKKILVFIHGKTGKFFIIVLF
jgi:hypothetical protein